MLSKFVDSVKKSEFCSCTTIAYIVVQPQSYGRTTIGHSFCREHIIRYKTDIFASSQPPRLKIRNLR